MSDRDDFDPDVLDLLARAVAPATPPTALRSRLFARIAGRDRFMPFIDRFATMCDLPSEEAEDHLHKIDQDDAWEDMTEGVRFFDFEGGPGIGEAHGGIVRVAPGHSFPMHTHVGEERILVLQGRAEDDQGRTYRAGDVVVSADGSAHEVRTVGDEEVIYLAVVVALEFPESGPDDA
jgi:quercetin dioxygenase-like cupin family protein